MSNSERRAIYFDTETTGIRPDKDRIIEIAAYDAHLDTTYSSLINPQIPIPEEASRIHGITDEMVGEAPTFAEVAKQFTHFCSGEVALIAHNNDAFDRPFLHHELHRAGQGMPDNWLFIDSLKWSRRYRSDLPKHSLQFLRETFEIEANQAHRAMDDVVILYKVFSQMIGDLDMYTIHKLLTERRLLRHMPFGKHQGKPLDQVPKSYVRWLKESGALDKKNNDELVYSFEKLGFFS